MTRRFADFNNPAPQPWTWVDTVLVGIVAFVATSAFGIIVGVWFLVHPSGSWP